MDQTILIFFYNWLHSPSVGPGRFVSFLILYTVDSLNVPSARRKAATYTEGTQTSMLRVGF
jgi:hypothetical protein